jgi:hypothetical protein
VGQTLGCADQIQRWPTPSRALCLQTHQTRPCPRNHRPGRVRTWPRPQSGRTSTAKLAFHTCPPTPGAAVGIRPHLPSASKEPPVAARCSHRRGPPPEARYSWCARAAERARRAHPGSLRESRSRRSHACSGVLPGCRAQHVPPRRPETGARSTHRPQAVTFSSLRHLGWPRMRGVAPVCSHYPRIAVEPAAHADQTGLPDPVWRSRRLPMGPRAAAVPACRGRTRQAHGIHLMCTNLQAATALRTEP